MTTQQAVYGVFNGPAVLELQPLSVSITSTTFLFVVLHLVRPGVAVRVYSEGEPLKRVFRSILSLLCCVVSVDQTYMLRYRCRVFSL